MDKEYLLPSQSFGFTAIESIHYQNWFHNESVYDYTLNKDIKFKSNLHYATNTFDSDYNYLTDNCIPIGSVEYVLEWLRLMGVAKVKPLNIPRELWKHCNRDVRIDYCANVEGHWMLKDTETIKDEHNKDIWLDGLDIGEYDSKKYFLSEWVDNICSEWRVFVYNNRIRGIQCYSGDYYTMPNQEYIKSITNSYDKQCYTLDVFVDQNGCTDILELHDFFSCGLYGFEDYRILPAMWITAIKDILSNGLK